MTTGRLSSPVPLSRATSRTRTARHPLATLNVAHVEGTPDLGSIYAGPVARDAHSPFLPGTLRYPPMSEALQVYGLSEGNAASYLGLVVDLGRQCEVSRVELYGNLLLPPFFTAGQPVHNFGLPRGVAIAVSEAPIPFYDLHRRPTTNLWASQEGLPWHQRFLTYDFRALWGWTPISLPPTFGRHLTFLFFDLPLIFPDGSTTPRPGIDIQRLVVYPFLQDTDHRPLIEASPLASWQHVYDQTSRYWNLSGGQTPHADSHQSLFRSADHAAWTPAVLDGIVHLRQGQKPARLYSSDRVKPGTDNRVHLIVQATTDEIPLLNGVGLSFAQPASLELPGNLYNYRIEAWVTNDPEAAWSPTSDHPSWKFAMASKLVRASLAAPNLTVPLMFPSPQHARYVRLTVDVLETEGLPNDDARFILAGLSLIRPRDYVLTPEDGQDLRLDYVVMRMRGAELFGDHAFVDGANGAGLTLEVQEGGGPFKTLQSFRSLLDLLENTQNRAYSNQRFNEKRVQVTSEVTDSSNRGHQSTTAKTTNDATSFVDYNDGNYTVTVTGAVTEHKDNFGQGALREFSWLQEGDLGYVHTERKYGDPDQAEMQLSEIFSSDVPATFGDFLGRIGSVARTFDEHGRPLSLSIGGSGSLNFSLGGGGSVGASVSASGQVGGGVTRTKNTGKQGSVTNTESKTLEARNRQYVTGTQTAGVDQNGTSHDERRITRTDLSDPERQKGVGIQYGGNAEDILLIAIPVNALLRGHDAQQAYVVVGAGGLPGGGAIGAAGQSPRKPKAPRDVLRLRIDHLPPGVTLDVEFRGSVLPKDGGKNV